MKGTGVGQRPQRVKWIIINFHDQLCFICSKFVNLQEEVFFFKKKQQIQHAWMSGKEKQILRSWCLITCSHPSLKPVVSAGGGGGAGSGTVDNGREEARGVLLALVQQARAGERGSSMKRDGKDSLSSHPHYVNEVHDCSVGPLRVNYQWLLSLIG